jgi:hypothetical protein
LAREAVNVNQRGRIADATGGFPPVAMFGRRLLRADLCRSLAMLESSYFDQPAVSAVSS